MIEGDHSKPSFIASILVSAGYDSLGLSCKRKVLGFPLELWLTSAYLQLSGVYSPRDGMRVHEES